MGRTFLVASVGKYAPHQKFAPGESQALLATSFDKAKEAGFEVEYVEVDPKRPTEMLNLIKEKLKSRHWDGFSVGWGVRGLKESNELFEAVMNASREITPETKFVFSTGPDTVFEAMKRAFPEA